MAKQVEGISEKVELCAKKEFLEKGYVDASLRTIAAEAGTTTGTIYSRYGGKEGLFSAIVEPVAKEFTGIFIGVQEKFHAIESDRQAVSLDDYAEDGMKQLVKYMYAHLEEFQILVKSSYGTRFQDFVEHLVELETDYTYKYNLSQVLQDVPQNPEILYHKSFSPGSEILPDERTYTSQAASFRLPHNHPDSLPADPILSHEIFPELR